MALYTRPQLIVLLLVVLVAGVGLGVGHWRRTHPEIAARLERFDRVPTPFTATVDELPLAPRRARPAGQPRDVPAAPPQPVQPVDVNHASEEELRALPGIGGVLAARIVEARERGGPFASLEDLRRVRGLGRAKLEKLTTAIALGR
jgi:competence ComEA-like helix-hairpin-helix protein